MHKQVVLIVAGGSGTRFGSQLPKHFWCINGVPIIILTIQKFLFYNADISIYLAVHVAYVDYAARLVNHYFNNNSIKITVGGSTRTATVANALKLIDGDSHLAIHDAARPFVSAILIQKMFEALQHTVAAVPIVQVTDTLLHQNSTVERSEYYVVQTPQCFHAKELKEVHLLAEKEGKYYTDDAQMLRNAGYHVAHIEGETGNIKITYNDALMQLIVTEK